MVGSEPSEAARSEWGLALRASWNEGGKKVVPVLLPSQVLEALPRFEAAKERLEISWGKKAPWDLVIAEARYAI